MKELQMGESAHFWYTPFVIPDSLYEEVPGLPDTD